MTTMGPFIRMPIPQDVWTMATNTAGGPTMNGMPDQLTLSLTVASGRQGLRANQGDVDRGAGPADGHRLLQLVRHPAS